MSKRVTVLVLASLALGACSSVPNWARPSTVADRLLGRDAAPATGNQFPTVGDVPRQAPATNTPAQRQATVAGLTADRANAQYTDEQLRQGGQVAAAPTAAGAPTPAVTQAPLAAPAPAPAPGPAPGPATSTQVAQAAPRPGTNAGAPNLTVPDLAVPVPPVFQGGPQVTLGQAAAPQPIPPPTVAIVPAPAPRAAAPASTQAPIAAAPAPAVTTIAPIGPAAVPPPPAVQAPPAPAATPVVPAAPPPVPTLAQVNRVLPTQNAGGQDLLARTFAQMLQQSQQTVTVQSPLGGAATGVAPVVPQQTLPRSAAANQPMPAAGMNIVPRAASGTTGTFNLGGTAAGQAGTVAFPHDSSTLSAEARRTIRTVADAYKARGGHVRVVGHASTRTRDMPVDLHVLTNFRVSVERAKAVADELLRLGVPPAALIVDAVGDAQPRFLEAMPAGEAGNRRVELYLEA